MVSLSLSKSIPAHLPFSLPSSASPDDFSQSFIFYLSFILLTTSFHILSPFLSKGEDRKKTEKKLSWIITSIASLIMTLQSIPFLYDYFESGGSVRDVRTAPTLAVAANRFFQAYLVSDLTIGAFNYRSQINLLTGWVHHILYIGIVEYAIRQGWASVFSLCACMEFPTFVLGLSILVPQTRSNLFFAVSFFATRILLHVVLTLSYYMPMNRPLSPGSQTIGSLAPALILTAVFPLHASWFYGCIKGFIRRAKQTKEAATSVQATTIKLQIYSEPSSSPVPSSSKPKSIPAPAKLITNAPTHVPLPIFPFPLPVRVRVPVPVVALASRLLHRPYAHYSNYYNRYAQYRTRFRAFRAEVRDGVRESLKEGTKRAKDYGRKAKEGVKGVRERSSSIGSAREVVYEAVGLGRKNSRDSMS
ncbi:hypothetical protein VKT23_012637 [Stygiomarasmius scandens]|uniref:TLC domain-containing protein n=1 Tax=Marasmiellus scandens TaxID=2682957 RepID=A0ABR1JB52_9AGAR